MNEQEIRLDQTKKVFKVLADAINDGSISYRNLIYDKLGFTGYYEELMAGLTITNAIVDLEEKNKIIDEMLNFASFDVYCPYEFWDEEQDECDRVKKICDCDNCKEDYKKCWLKYFKNKILERGKNVNRVK